jgi:TPR repeat protein
MDLNQMYVPFISCMLSFVVIAVEVRMSRNNFFDAILTVLLVVYSENLSAEVLQNNDKDEPELIQLYTQDELNSLIKENRHLERIKIDECQFTRDIKDRAMILNYPAYLYLWADMNFTDTCIKGNVADGVVALKLAADKGMPVAMYKLGGLYLTGKYVQSDYDLAYRYIYDAASLGNDEAKLTLVNLLVNNEGNEADFVNAYHWLFKTVYSDPKKHELAKTLLSQLKKKMPISYVEKAEKME